MLKKKMKNNIYFLIGIFFVFSLFPFVSSAGFDWVQYGNGFSPAHQSQYETGYTEFDEVIDTLTYTSAGIDQFTHPTQPLVDELGDTTETNYVFGTYGNYLKVFDNNLDLYTEEFVGMSSMGQVGVVDWDNDGGSEIAGFWRYNTTQIHFKVYEVNHTSGLIDEKYDYNFSYPATNGISGVRCTGNECYTLLYDTNGSGYLWKDFYINSTDVTLHQLYATRENTYAPIEAPSFIDYDSDGTDDYLVWSQDRVVVYDKNGVVIANWSMAGEVRGAKFFNADASPYYKVGILTRHGIDISNCGSGAYSCAKLWIKNVVDETEVWSGAFLGSSGSLDNTQPLGFAVNDYNDDGYDDLWLAVSKIDYNNVGHFYIVKGDGTTIFSSTTLGGDYGATYPSSSMTLGRMDSDSSFDAMIYANNELRVFSPALDSMIYSNSLSATTGQASCVPADLNWDGFLDGVCADASSIEQLTPAITNSNPTINSVAYDPSTLVSVNETLSAIISATDTEGNNILYRHRCYDADNWSAEDGSNVKECEYSSVGTYVLTIGVRDGFHSSYNTFAQDILVTTSGAVCDNDFICEAEQGETYINCPNDCPSPEDSEVPDTTTTEGGITLPTELVDTDDTSKGLLPEIYYGTLAFMSNVLSPFIILVFVIFFAMIMLTIGAIIRKVGDRVGSLSR